MTLQNPHIWILIANLCRQTEEGVENYCQKTFQKNVGFLKSLRGVGAID
jgi:hypothetical protein